MSTRNQASRQTKGDRQPATQGYPAPTPGVTEEGTLSLENNPSPALKHKYGKSCGCSDCEGKRERLRAHAAEIRVKAEAIRLGVPELIGEEEDESASESDDIHEQLVVIRKRLLKELNRRTFKPNLRNAPASEFAELLKMVQLLERSEDVGQGNVFQVISPMPMEEKES